MPRRVGSLSKSLLGSEPLSVRGGVSNPGPGPAVQDLRGRAVAVADADHNEHEARARGAEQKQAVPHEVAYPRAGGARDSGRRTKRGGATPAATGYDAAGSGRRAAPAEATPGMAPATRRRAVRRGNAERVAGGAPGQPMGSPGGGCRRADAMRRGARAIATRPARQSAPSPPS